MEESSAQDAGKHKDEHRKKHVLVVVDSDKIKAFIRDKLREGVAVAIKA